MNYIFKGKLCGYICAECWEPLEKVKVRLYRSRPDQNVTALAVAAPKDTFAILSDEETEAKASSLIAEVETDDSGQFVFELGEKQGYKGEAFEVDVYCGTVPHRPPGRREPTPLQFSITTIHPMWRETDQGYLAGWEYCISQRYWCWILRRFGVWVICGRVVICGTQTPVPGVKVSAFDVDWLQDDALGTALTDANGRFRIYYVAAGFQKGTFLNVELVGGPDIYFKIATTGGITLLQEDPSRGRKPDRENRGNCFCVELCLEHVVPPSTDVPPSFTHVGVVNIQTQIDTGTGLTISDHRAFHSTLRLYGTVPKKLNGNQTEYMFDVAEYDPGTNVLGAHVKIKPGQIARTPIGQRIIVTGNPGNPVQVDDWTVNGNAGEPTATFTPDEWIQVPQDNHFYPNTGPRPGLIRLDSQTLAPFGTVNQAAVKAGSSSAPLASDRHFQIRMWVRESGNAGSAQIVGTCTRIAVDNTLYDNVTHGGSWAPEVLASQIGVSMVDIKELVNNGCGGIQDELHVLYTSAHPNLGSVSLEMKGPGGPYGFTLAPGPGAGAGNQFGSATLTPPQIAKDLNPCAYIVTLSTSILLTDGDDAFGTIEDRIGFCKK